MRAIDADALIAKCGNWYCEEGTEEGFIGDIKHLIDAQPTIEPRKGKWVRANTPTDGIYECSVCLQWTFIPFHPSTYNYCPRCGSDMRGDDDEI